MELWFVEPRGRDVAQRATMQSKCDDVQRLVPDSQTTCYTSMDGCEADFSSHPDTVTDTRRAVKKTDEGTQEDAACVSVEGQGGFEELGFASLQALDVQGEVPGPQMVLTDLQILRSDSAGSADPDSDLPHGWHLGKHEVAVKGIQLGKGSFGSVYQAVYCGRIAVAVKVALEDAPAEEQARILRDMRREMYVAAKLPKHPNLPTFVGVVDAGSNRPALVWELIDGYNLDVLFARDVDRGEKPFHSKPHCTLGWCRQLFAGLTALHERSLIHRDVKPSNVMVTLDHKTIKLIDYGLARELPAPALTSSACPRMTGQTGSFRWMAPEVWRGDFRYTEKVDVYSASMCAWMIAIGSVPFSNLAGDTVAELAARQHLRPGLGIDPKKSVPTEFWALIQRGWAPLPSDRPDAKTCQTELETMEVLLRKVSGERSLSPIRHLKRLVKQGSFGRTRSKGGSGHRLSVNSSISNLDETCAVVSGKLQSPLFIDDPTPIETGSLGSTSCLDAAKADSATATPSDSATATPSESPGNAVKTKFSQLFGDIFASFGS